MITKEQLYALINKGSVTVTGLIKDGDVVDKIKGMPVDKFAARYVTHPDVAEDLIKNGVDEPVVDEPVEPQPKPNEELVEELLAALKNGGDVVLNENTTVPERLVMQKAGTINLNGNTLTSDENGKDSIVISGASADVEVTIKNGTFTSNNKDDGYGVITVQKNPKLILEDVNVNGLNPIMMYSTGNGTIEVKSGTFESPGAQAVYYYKGAGKVVIEGGEFKAEPYQDKYYTLNIKDNYRPASGDMRDAIEVRGGRFYKFNPADCISEGEHTNFVADGFESVQDGDWFVVQPVKVAKVSKKTTKKEEIAVDPVAEA